MTRLELAVAAAGGRIDTRDAGLIRTARRLFEGNVLIPRSARAGRETAAIAAQ